MAHWSVTVERNGEPILTIGHNSVGGRSLSESDQEVVRNAAAHLKAFVGERKPEICECASFAKAKGPYPSGICPECNCWYPGVTRAQAIARGDIL